MPRLETDKLRICGGRDCKRKGSRLERRDNQDLIWAPLLFTVLGLVLHQLMSKPRSARSTVSKPGEYTSINSWAQEAHKYIGKYKSMIFFLSWHGPELTAPGGPPTEVDLDTPPPSQSSTRSKPRASKATPKRGTSVYSLREEEEEQTDSLFDGYTDQLTEPGDIDVDAVCLFNPLYRLYLSLVKFAYILWVKGHISNEKLEQAFESVNDNKSASNFKRRLSLNPVLSRIPERAESICSMDSISTRRTTRSMTQEKRLIEATISTKGPSRLAKIVTILIEGALAPGRPSPERLRSSNSEILKKQMVSTYLSNVKNPSPPLRLWAKIRREGHYDSTKEWLIRLRIPCSIIRTNSDHITTESFFTLDEDQSFDSLPPDSLYASSEDGESDDDTEGTEVTEDTEPATPDRPMRSR
ncbi:10553_t:CDS:2 [Acaulospora colombiana]|uniref:10553_t:CDS:1 n=1 Tax=Acaulospora colombiana TaxID=27376 RepID=A0ACA9M1S2_9GLOM|nr:10553_t:CDS:2 [Acaulospora colombiana]